jgi:uncharacterized protein YsxB (DUF464 family)
MISAEIVVDEEGLLVSCAIHGHAGAGVEGSDVVCAAVSVLARTAAAVLDDACGIAARCEFPVRGEFLLEAAAREEARKDFLAGVSSFLIEGLASVADEYPNHCVCLCKKQKRLQ